MSHTEKEAASPVEIRTKELMKVPEEEPGEEPVQEASQEEAPEQVPKKEPIKERIKKLITKRRRFLTGAIIILFALLLIYFGMVLYFRNHFYFGTKINGINVSGKTLEDAKAVVTAKLDIYKLTIKERGGKIEQIKAHEVGLKNISDKELKKVKDSQNSFKWILAFFTSADTTKTILIKYDEKLLQEQINQLSIFNLSNIVEPQNASFKYLEKSYVIIDEVIGNKVDKNILYSHVADSIHNMEAEIDLESKGCYVKPQYNAKSPKIIEVKNTLNKYVSTNLTYTFEKVNKTLDRSDINQWLAVDENLQVTVNEEMVKAFINQLANTYNTVGKTRNFVTSSGETIQISGGDYGRSIDKVKETEYLVSAIKKGETITKEPVFSQKAFSDGNNCNDIGNNYVEISISNQHIWFYKNGALIVQGNVVTGNVSGNYSTRKGIYSLKSKARDVVLRGPDYAVHVDYWMPFDGGIGIHDANWRNQFGLNIFLTNGSHGCVNAPYYVAKDIFDNITPGTPVICY